MEFRLSIRLGNAAMMTGDDVARALATAADKFAREYEGFDLSSGEPFNGSIRDENGNRVGAWEVSA